MQHPSFDSVLADRQRRRDANPLTLWMPSSELVPSSQDRRSPERRNTSDRRQKKRRLLEGQGGGDVSVDSSDRATPSYELETVTQARSTSITPTQAQASKSDEDDEEPLIGPQPLHLNTSNAAQRTSYGTDLLPGEGAAIASYIQQGQRIPRRGEIGLSTDKIESYERAGYVMSGSRNFRINAVRIRKEEQVKSVEERRAAAREKLEERVRKEAEIVGQFREMVAERTRAAMSQQHNSDVL